MKYIRGDLSKVASWYYHNDYANPIRFEIYEAIKNKLHPRAKIEHEFSEETAKIIDQKIKELNENN